MKFEVSHCDVCAMTPTLSSWLKLHTHTFRHTNLTPSMSRAALRWTYPPQSLTLPSSAISFVFSQMRCSRPGGSNTVWGAITQKQSVTIHCDLFLYYYYFLYSSYPTVSQIIYLSTTAWLPLNLQDIYIQISRESFPQYHHILDGQQPFIEVTTINIFMSPEYVYFFYDYMLRYMSLWNVSTNVCTD